MARGLFAVVFLSLLAAVLGKVTPIEQVVKMLTDLQTKVIVEGKAEAKTYDKFACFCKDSTDEKSAAITDGQTTVDSLVGKINDRQSDRSTIDGKINELNEQIAKLNEEMAAEKKAHKANQKHFETEDDEKQGAITGLEEAIKSIKAATNRPKGMKGHSVSMVVKKSIKSIQSSLMLADALGLGSAEAHREVAKLLQVGQTPGEVAYDENEDTSAALGTLVALDKDFHSQKNQNANSEAKRVFAYDSFMQQRTDEKKLAEKHLDKQKKMHAQRSAEIAEFQQQLTEAQATLKDDQAYIKDLVSKCNSKSEDWDKRTTMRSGELAAISQALNIITSKIQNKPSSLLQLAGKKDKSWSQMGAIIASRDLRRSSVIARKLQSPRVQLSLISKAASSHKAPDDQVREEVLDLLRTKGQELKSTMLVRIAGQMQNDPFGKIKTLISELISRMNQEAADEATHKGWCDKSLNKAKSTREDKAEAIANLNSELEMKQIAKDKLIDDIDTLKAQIEELDNTKDEFTKVRQDEKAENEATIKEAEDGLQAVQDAKEVLKKFYGEEAPSLVERSTKQKNEPDAGFEGGDGRDQEGGANIIALMDVIEGDFKRTISGTKKEEDQAERDFKALKRTTEISHDTKTSDKEAKESELAATKDHIAKKFDDLKGEQELLDKTLEELIELQPACIDTGMSYQDRVAKREEEIQSLNEALCMLEKHGPVPEATQSCE